MNIYYFIVCHFRKHLFVGENGTTYISIFKKNLNVLKLNKVLTEVSEGQLDACSFDIFSSFSFPISQPLPLLASNFV